MIKVRSEQLKQIEELFKGIQDSMVIACIQGYMGDAYVDKLPDPHVGLIVSGEYSFFAGDTKSEGAVWLAENLFELNPGDETVCIFADDEPEWEKVLMRVEKYAPALVPRYGIIQKDYVFDEELLKEYMDRLPDEYHLKMFDKDIYEQAMSEDWSREFCETFESGSDFLDRGFGCAIVHKGKLAAGISTMTVYDGGAEVQVATHPDYRRKGLATICAAAFLMESQKCGIRACWDAANEISKNMALSLGYKYKGIYTTVSMKRNGEGMR